MILGLFKPFSENWSLLLNTGLTLGYLDLGLGGQVHHGQIDSQSNTLAKGKQYNQTLTLKRRRYSHWTNSSSPSVNITLQQECIPLGCVPSAAVVIWMRGLLGGCLPRGVSARGCLPRGCMAACNGADTPLWTDFFTHACENITFPQLLLRTVITVFGLFTLSESEFFLWSW